MMGIQNIHILTQPQIDHQIIRAREELEAKLMAEHRSGMHPYGSMRRECPLCQAGK